MNEVESWQQQHVNFIRDFSAKPPFRGMQNRPSGTVIREKGSGWWDTLHDRDAIYYLIAVQSPIIFLTDRENVLFPAKGWHDHTHFYKPKWELLYLDGEFQGIRFSVGSRVVGNYRYNGEMDWARQESAPVWTGAIEIKIKHDQAFVYHGRS